MGFMTDYGDKGRENITDYRLKRGKNYRLPAKKINWDLPTTEKGRKFQPTTDKVMKFLCAKP